MKWRLALSAPLLVGAVLLLSRLVPAAILAYHLLCAIAVARHRARVRVFLQGGRNVAAWALVASLLIGCSLFLGPLLQDPAPYRDLFRRRVLPWGDASAVFPLFAAYTLIVHAPLEEIFWRGVVMDPERSPLRTAIAGSALGFYLIHAVPMGLLLGSRGLLLALPTAAAGALWAFVTIRSRSLWPGLVSHWGADGVILVGMWFYFIR
jgi:membrane protease YdiL (CAAX protease family)